MLLRWIVAAIHLLALGIGLGSVTYRAAALRGTLDPARLRRVFRADALWGLAGFLWISTGLARAFFGLDKGTSYYLGSTAFRIKMGLLIVLLILEVAPIVILPRWRGQVGKNEAVDTSRAGWLSRLSLVQTALVLLMLLAATALARGLFY
jgi:putative membrane protein